MTVRRLARRAGLALLIVTGGVVALGVGSLVFLGTRKGNELLLDLLLDQAPRFVPNGSLAVEDLHFKPWTYLELDGVSLRDAQGRELVGIDRLVVDYDLRGVLRRKLVVEELRLERPQVDLQALPDGRLDVQEVLGLEPAPAEEAPSEPWQGLPAWIVLEEARISDGGLRYRAEGTDLRLADLALRASGSVRGREARVEGLDLAGQLVSPGDLPLAVTGSLAYVEGDLAVDNLVLALGSSRVLADGSVGAIETGPDLGLELSARLSPADLAALTGEEEPPILQEVVVALQARGPLRALEASGELIAPAGRMGVDAAADLEADPIAWSLDLLTTGFELDALLTAVTEQTRLEGRYHVEGTGMRWPEAPGETGPDLLRASVEIEGADQVLWGEPVRDLRLVARVDAGRVSVRELSGQHALGRLSLAGDVDVPAATASVSGTAWVPDLSALRRYGVEGVGGEARWEGQVAVDWSAEDVAVAATGTLSASELTAPGGVAVAELAVPLEARVDGGAVDASGQLLATSLGAAGASVGEARLSWTFSRGQDGALSAELTGIAASNLDAPDARASVATINGDLRGGQTAGGDPWLSWDLAMDGIVLPTGGRGGGTIQGSLQDDHLVAVADFQGPQGPILQLDAAGDLETGAWSIPTLVIAPTPGTPWRAPEPIQFQLVEGGVEGIQLALRSEVGAVAAMGQVKNGAIDATLVLDELDLAWVADVARRLDPSDPLGGLQGHLDLMAQVKSDGDLPPDVTARLAVDGLSQPGAVEAPVDVALELALRDDDLRLDGGVEREGRRWLSVGGDIPVEVRMSGGAPRLRCGEEVAARVIAGPLSSRELGEVVPGAAGAFEQAALDLQVLGDVCDPEIRALASGRVWDEGSGRLLRADLDLARAGSELRLYGSLEADMARQLQVDGTARTGLSDVLQWALAGGAKPDLEAPSTWVTDLELSVVPLGVPLEVLGAPEQLGGRVAGGLQISGSVDDLQVAGGLQWLEGRIGTVELNLGFFGLVPTEGGYELTTLIGFERGGDLAIEGFVPLSVDLAGDLQAGLERAFQDDRLAIRISDGQGGHARVPMETLTGNTTGLEEAEGVLELWGTVRGTLAAPIPDLQLRMNDGALTVKSTAVRYDEIVLDAELRRDRLLVREVAMRSRPRYGVSLKRGSLRMDGQLALADFAIEDVSLDAEVTDFQVSATEDMTLSATGEIQARGPWPDLTLQGELALGNTRIRRTKDDFLQNASLTLSPDILIYRDGALVTARERGERPPIWERFRLDLGVDLQRNLRLLVEMPTQAEYGAQFAELSTVSLDAELDGQLRVLGTAGDPNLRGTIETVRGDVELLGAAFKLEPEGTIAFVGGGIDNPILDLEAVRQTGAYGDVTIDITQDVQHIQIDFRAEDYPDPADAMALVLFGRPTSELTDTEGEAGTQVLNMALSSLSGQVERAVGLSAFDQFEVDPSTGAVRVGKALSEQLFLTLEIQMAQEDESDNQVEATVEWLILRSLYAEFVTGDQGQSSADLFWRWRF